MTTLVPKYDQGATGAVNRPFNEKLAEFISVKDFGAIGTANIANQAADTAAFAAICNAAWTPEVIAAYKAQVEQSKLGE
jgi:hypothetical protein